MKKSDLDGNGALGTELSIFIPALLAILVFCISAMVFPETAKSVAGAINAYVTDKFGWAYLVLALGIFASLTWLAMGPFGRIKMGGENSRPEFTNFAWMSMLFCAGQGPSLLLWAVAEPIYYLQGPPLGAFFGVTSEPTGNTVSFAASYGLFHWGITGWAIYCIPTLPLAYHFYARKNRQLRFSNCMDSVIGDRIWIKRMIDVAVVFGILAACCPGAGIQAPMIAIAFGRILGFQGYGLGLLSLIVILWILIYSTSLMLGLKKGIARLSSFNMYILLFFVCFIFVTGPTGFIVNTYIDSIGIVLDNFFRMSLWTDSVAKNGFPQTWTMFYWAWWIGYAPMMGLFVARISYGRSIRGIIFGEIVLGTIGTCSMYAILANYTLYVETAGTGFLSKALAQFNSTAAPLVALVENLPFGKSMLVVFVVMSMIFLATTMDSAAYVMSATTTKQLDFTSDPSKQSRLLWAFVLGGVTITMLVLGGLSILQQVVTIMAVPLIPILATMLWAFIKDLHDDYPGLRKDRITYAEYNDAGELVRSGDIK